MADGLCVGILSGVCVHCNMQKLRGVGWQSHASLNLSRVLFRMKFDVRVFAKAGNSLIVQPGTNA